MNVLILKFIIIFQVDIQDNRMKKHGEQKSLLFISSYKDIV